jgi:hypothetical protein
MSISLGATLEVVRAVDEFEGVDFEKEENLELLYDLQEMINSIIVDDNE